MGDRTIASIEEDEPSARSNDVERPALVLVLACQRPMMGGMCFPLDAVSRVTLGRGERTAAHRIGRDTLHVDVDDSRMSARHATIERGGASWHLIDEGSTNGSRHNGRLVRRSELHDGDSIQLGHTLFVFRADGAAAVPSAPPPRGFDTLDAAYRRQLCRLQRIALTDLAVLLIGETGTGKEVIARSIHALSDRAGPMVAVNCGAIPSNLIESQLFGHEKGAFSGAHQSSPGFVRAADGGTLFLDEIGELPPPAQVALLRVLQEHEVVPVGATKPISVRLRVIAATHQPLRQEVDAGTFRADLYARLAGFEFELPPLRERIVDLGMLVAAILDGSGVDGGGLRLRPDVGTAMLGFPWPQNIRQLEQALLAATALCEDDVIRLDDMPLEIRAWAAEHPAPEKSPSVMPEISGEEAELRASVVAALRASDGNVSAAARTMGKARQQMQRWIRRFAIRPDEYER